MRGDPNPMCVAHRKSDGAPCGLRAVNGGTVCAKHGGAAPQVRAANRRNVELAKARKAALRLGIPVEISPIEALEQSLWEAAGNVAVYRTLVGDLGLSLTDEEGSHVAGYRKVPHIFVQMYDSERDRLAKIAKECAALGLDERRVQMAEDQAQRLFGAITRSLNAIPVEYREVFRANLANEIRGSAVVTG